MILEALSNSTEPNGLETGAIASFIEVCLKVKLSFFFPLNLLFKSCLSLYLVYSYFLFKFYVFKNILVLSIVIG